MKPGEEQRRWRVLLLAPTATDARISESMLAQAGIACTTCADLRELCQEIQAGAGAVLLTEESLKAEDQAALLADTLHEQPQWSDLPIVLLASGGSDSALAVRALRRLSNVLLLDRPVRLATLYSALETALRARRRQYEIRDYLVQRQRAEAALQQAKEAAEAANRAKSQFLAAMSHELRTPMNAILGMTDLALAEAISPAVRDYLQTAKESADLLLELLNEILDFSRIEAGRFELESIPFNLRQAVEQVVKTFGVRAYQKGLELVYELPDEMPESLLGDPLRLRQVLMNLVSNAIKFTAKGEIVVRVQLRQQTAEAVALEFSVTDTGIGIAAEDQERVFTPFTQADASTTRHYGGTGLGLAICQRIVAMMGGRLWLESQLGRGSTFFFTVTLPIAPQAVDHPKPDLPDQEAFRDLPVLVVAENATSRRILRQTLANWAMRPAAAPDAPTALTMIHQAAAAQNHYRLVLADADLPGIDGFTLSEWLRKEPQLAGPPILMLSAADRQNHPERCRQLEVTCLDKPISQSALFKAIVRALQLEGQAMAADAAEAERPLATPARPLRVLVAEDTPANQKLVLYILGKRGHTTEVAQNGQQAVELLVQQDFDAVLMDVQMPLMDGFQATQAIRALNDPQKARLPIIAMTAHALKGDAERCLEAGMDAYVSKPINATELIQLVERLSATAVHSDGEPGRETPDDGVARAPEASPAESSSSVFHLDEAVNKCFGQYALFQDMVGSLFEEADPLIAQMQTAVEHGDGPTLSATAHRLKGTVVYLAAPPATEATRQVEQLARSGDLPSAAAAIRRLEEAIGHLKAALVPHRRAEKN